jgi:predicted nuclease with TOPRIM domain
MDAENTKHKEILDAVGSLTKKTDDLAEKTDEILQAVGHFSDKTEERFNGIEGRLDKVESNMVTRDYLDEKLADLKGDMYVTMRKGDKKLTHLINILESRKVISSKDANEVLSLEPFPQS